MDDAPTGLDKSRQAAADDRYVSQLENENSFLKTQVAVKDTQIAALLERDHETNAHIERAIVLKRFLVLEFPQFVF